MFVTHDCLFRLCGRTAPNGKSEDISFLLNLPAPVFYPRTTLPGARRHVLNSQKLIPIPPSKFYARSLEFNFAGVRQSSPACEMKRVLFFAKGGVSGRRRVCYA